MIVKSIRDVLGDRPLNRVSPEATLRDAARMMEEGHVGALAVMDGDRLVGILSERDIVWRGVAHALPSDTTRVAEVMTADPITVEAGDALSDALAAKLGDAYRHLPVMDGDAVVGVLSYRDIPAEYLALYERFNEMRSARADEG